MQILSIPDIKGNFYGGFPYSLSLEMGFSSEPSSLTIQCVNENGIYDKPDLSWVNKISIKVGDLNFQGFLTRWKKNNTVPQKTLELTYQDTSCLLDKFYVGLHKRHGINPQATASYNNTLGIGYKNIPNNNSFPNLIIMGREMHPCDINNDGVINDIDTNIIDPCDPCPNCPQDKFKYRCTAENDLKIFEVKYRFSDLLDYLNIPVPTKIKEKTNYYRDYEGKLRDVLSRWCNDFSYTYYWDFSSATLKDGIKLVDRSVPISVDLVPNECEVTEVYEGESIENSFAQGTISYYAREGRSQQYQCSDVKYQNLNCLRIRQLYDPNNYTDFDSGLKWRELAIGLSYYSSAMRDCLFWFNYYGILNADDAKEKTWDINLESNPIVFQQNKDKILKELGNMKIFQVIKKSDDAVLFNNCLKLMGDAIAPFEQRSEDLERDSSNPSYYFFIAEHNEEIAANSINYDSRLAEEFLGRYWLRQGNFASCAGISGNTREPSVSVEGWNGEQGNFVAQGQQGYLPKFCDFGHEQSSPIDSFITETKASPEATNTFIETNKAFILLEREAKWYPNNSDLSKYNDTLNFYQNLIFQKVDTTSDGKPELLSQINPKYSQNKNISLFIVQEIDELLSISISNVDNFLEPNGLQEIYADNQDSGPCITNTSSSSTGKTLIGTVGLKSSNCAWVDFNGFAFMMPAQSTELQDGVGDRDPFNDNPNSGGYKVKVDTSFNIPVCIPKIQTVLSNLPDPNENFGSLEINWIEISDEDINIFGGESCTPSPEKLEQIHREKGIQTSVSNTNPEKNIQYTIIGLPQNTPSINQGLDNISIKVDDGGVFTSYSLSDKIRQPPTYDTIISDTLRRRYPTVSSYPTPNPRNIPNGL